MSAFFLDGDSDYALALREPRLLVPGQKPYQRLSPKPSIPIFRAWSLGGNAGAIQDLPGQNTFTVSGPEIRGNLTWFDEVNDYITTSLALPTEGVLYFHLRVEDNSGSLFQYFCSNGNFNAGLNVYISESAHPTNPDKLIVNCHTTAGNNAEIPFYSASQQEYFCAVAFTGSTVTVHCPGQAPNSAAKDIDITGTRTTHIGRRADADADRHYGGGIYAIIIEDGVPPDSVIQRRLENFYGEFFQAANQTPYLVGVTAAGGLSLSVFSALHGHSAAQPALTQANALAANDATHAHAADAPALTQQHIIAPTDALHSHLADAPDMTQQHVLAVMDSTHAHLADNAALTVAGTLSVADALHGHAAASPGLAQASTLVTASALHAHSAEQPTLDIGMALSPSDATHAHTADSPAFTQAHLLAVQDALHAHYADSTTLPTHVTLVASDALHAHLADNAYVYIGTLETPAGRVYLVEARVRAYRVDSPVAAHLIH